MGVNSETDSKVVVVEDSLDSTCRDESQLSVYKHLSSSWQNLLS